MNRLNGFYMRFNLTCFFGTQHFDFIQAVFKSALVKLFQLRNFFLTGGYNYFTTQLMWNVMADAKIKNLPITVNAVFGF